MNRLEIESIFQEILINITHGDGINHPIRIVLFDKSVLNGFRIIENSQTYLLGFTEEQRKNQVKDLCFLQSTIIHKNKIIEVQCPELWR